MLRISVPSPTHSNTCTYMCLSQKHIITQPQKLAQNRIREHERGVERAPLPRTRKMACGSLLLKWIFLKQEMMGGQLFNWIHLETLITHIFNCRILQYARIRRLGLGFSNAVTNITLEVV